MIRHRVAPGVGQGKRPQRAARNQKIGSPMRGASQNDKPSDEPEPGRGARIDRGVEPQCIRNTHG